MRIILKKLKPYLVILISTVINKYYELRRNSYRYPKINVSAAINVPNYVKFTPAELIACYKFDVIGIVQVGAHNGQEIDEILAMMPNLRFVAFEPLKDKYNTLVSKYIQKPNVKLFNVALGKTAQKRDFWISSNDGQSSSLLEPAEHLVKSPSITFQMAGSVDVDVLDNYSLEINSANFLIIDTQGFELEVLMGALTIIKQIEYVYIEVNKTEVYRNCAQFGEIDNFLNLHGLYCTHVRWWDAWGDAFYCRRTK